MINILPNKADLFELNQRQFDIDSIIKGVKQIEDTEIDFRVICIGKRRRDSYKNTSVQLKKDTIIPPTLNSLQQMQHSFCMINRKHQNDGKQQIE